MVFIEKTFQFEIFYIDFIVLETEVFNKNVVVDLQSNEDIQRSFIRRCYQQVASYVTFNPRKTSGICRIYIHSPWHSIGFMTSIILFTVEYLIKLDI